MVRSFELEDDTGLPKTSNTDMILFSCINSDTEITLQKFALVSKNNFA